MRSCSDCEWTRLELASTQAKLRTLRAQRMPTDAQVKFALVVHMMIASGTLVGLFGLAVLAFLFGRALF